MVHFDQFFFHRRILAFGGNHLFEEAYVIDLTGDAIKRRIYILLDNYMRPEDVLRHGQSCFPSSLSCRCLDHDYKAASYSLLSSSRSLLTREGCTLTPEGTVGEVCSSLIRCARCLTMTACLGPGFAPMSASAGSNQA